MHLLLRSSLLLALCLLAVPSAMSIAPPQHFQACASQTGRTATLIVPAAAAPRLGNRLIQPGDELAVFTPSGACAGAAVWTGESLAVAIWEEDREAVARAGFAPGTPLMFRAWRAASNEVYTVAEDVEYDRSYDASGVFASDAIILLDRLAFAGDAGVEAGEPLAFELAPAYPNPFQTRTTLAYTLTEATDVRLEVFDLLGRRVAVLVDERLSAGRYEAPFQAESELSAGAYIGRLRAGEHMAFTRFTYLP
jgi:hypothetical protein